MPNSVPITQQQASIIEANFQNSPYPPNSSPAAAFTISSANRTTILSASSNATLAVDYGLDTSTGKYIPIAFAADNSSGEELSTTIFVTKDGVINTTAASALRAAYAANPDSSTPSAQTGNVFERSQIASFTADFTLSNGRDDSALNFVASGDTATGLLITNRSKPRPFVS